MVEHPRLWIGPWLPADAARSIRDPDADQTLGQFRSLPPPARRWWQVWSSPAAGFEVCETDDCALLMSISPRRFRTNLLAVRDCDGNLLGQLQGDEILDLWGMPFARRSSTGERRSEVRELDGRLYASAEPAGDGTLVQFSDADVTNPFVRLLALASILIGDGRVDAMR